MLMILTGMSGSGKDAIQKELTDKFEFERIVTVTTRPMREGEQNGRDYLFTSPETFKKEAERDRFIEHRSYNTLVEGKPDTWYYGSLKQMLNPNKDYCIILDIQGAKAFTEYYGKENCFVAEILVDDKIREERAMQRGSFDKTKWDRRLADDHIKFDASETKYVVNFEVDNSTNDLDDALYSLLEAYDAYTAFSKEKGIHYIIQEEMLNTGYYEPPESTFRVYDLDKLEKAIREEEKILKQYEDMLER